MTEPTPSTLIIVGQDPQQTLDIRAWVEAKDAWACRVVTTTTEATTAMLESAAPTVLVCVSDQATYEQARLVLDVAKATKTPSLVIYNQLDSPRLLELFRAGAAECLGRPVNVTRLSLVLDMVAAPRRVREQRARSSHPAGVAMPEASVPASVLGVEAPTNARPLSLDEQLSPQIERVAAIDTTVVITGETGTGKTRLAKAIHNASPRRDKPFLAVNCGALSETLMDSELFGHVKGAFTGADRNRTGKLSQCQDGTLLLDEVDMLSPAAQVKLLQVVEDRTFQPLGSAEQLPLKARLIVASNRSLKAEVQAGRFRSDLYYRLNVMTFSMPPLRERQDEIEMLAKQFAEDYSAHHGFPTAQLTLAAITALRAGYWGGNIRELRNVIERAVVISAGGTIDMGHLPAMDRISAPAPTPSGRIDATNCGSRKCIEAQPPRGSHGAPTSLGPTLPKPIPSKSTLSRPRRIATRLTTNQLGHAVVTQRRRAKRQRESRRQRAPRRHRRERISWPLPDWRRSVHTCCRP